MNGQEIIPSLSAQPADSKPRRSLVLAGGGMRVAWQAGVLKALEEAGLTFFHGDGTSGGTMNLAMLLSGLSPDEMCRRWRSLDVKDFVSLLPLRDYLKGLNVPALGDADGIAGKVFPHLGIDPARIRRSQGMLGTFNVCNYTRKTNESIPHTDIDLELLIAGISLPIFMPAVAHRGNLYLDSVWIKDANISEAVKRGAEELWLVWCIGNTTIYRDGPFNQYVHMIEISAAGKLNEEFEWVNDLNRRIARGDSPYGQGQPVNLHVVKPEYPLPLDPDFYAGRITAATLIDQGYADAVRYLAAGRPQGVPLAPGATQMRNPALGVSFRETMAGTFALNESDAGDRVAQAATKDMRLVLHVTIDIHDLHAFLLDPQHHGAITGHLDFPPFGENVPTYAGTFQLFAPGSEAGLKWILYQLTFRRGECTYCLVGKKRVHAGSVFRLWPDITRLHAQLHEGPDAEGPVIGAGVLRLGAGDVCRLLGAFHATNANGFGARLRVWAAFARFFARELCGNRDAGS